MAAVRIECELQQKKLNYSRNLLQRSTKIGEGQAGTELTAGSLDSNVHEFLQFLCIVSVLTSLLLLKVYITF